jgi:hypothetical protein
MYPEREYRWVKLLSCIIVLECAPNGRGTLAGLLVFLGHRPAVYSRLFAAIFNEKHNEANGEDNGDGAHDNLSWNCGTEGPTADPEVNRLRAGQTRNLAILLRRRRHTHDPLGGRDRPHPGREQKRLLPGQPHQLGRLATSRAKRGSLPLHPTHDRRRRISSRLSVSSVDLLTTRARGRDPGAQVSAVLQRGALAPEEPVQDAPHLAGSCHQPVDLATLAAGERAPASRGERAEREAVEQGADLRHGEPGLLREPDHRQRPEGAVVIATLAAHAAGGREQARALVVTKRRRPDTGVARDVPDPELGHERVPSPALT